MGFFDTIAAIATPPGEGGIAIVRISGPQAVEIADKAFHRRRGHRFSKVPWRVSLGEVWDSGGNSIDECLCTYFRAPRSFTGEDCVEMSTHGGSFVVGRVLERVLELGARLAEPGEFTKRAFLNGRLGLSQAEAVIDVIRATSDSALRQANRHLRGKLNLVVQDGREILVDVLAKIEASIDFPEHDIPLVTQAECAQALGRAEAYIDDLAATIRAGRVVKEGMRVVLAGRPNAGKSSLLNALAGQERAIVTEIAGTTRDTIEVNLDLAGVLVTLIDTAGLREGRDLVEQLGVARTEQAIEDADVVLVLIDGTGELNKEDQRLLQRTEGRRRAVLATKADLPQTLDLSQYVPLLVSVMTGQGLVPLKSWLTTVAAQEAGPENSVLVTNLRHCEALLRAREHLHAAKESCLAGWDLDIVAIDTRRAYEILGEITGETAGEDVIDSIFGRFCIGK